MKVIILSVVGTQSFSTFFNARSLTRYKQEFFHLASNLMEHFLVARTPYHFLP